MTVSLTFGGVNKGPLHWTGVLLHDQQDFISRASRPVEYNGQASSLYPYMLGGVLGHTYFGIQDEINSGLIVRKDVVKEELNINKLLAGRIDVACMSHIAALYSVKSMRLAELIHFSARPLNVYDRHILMQKGMDDDLYRYMDAFVSNLPSDSSWLNLLLHYGLR